MRIRKLYLLIAPSAALVLGSIACQTAQRPATLLPPGTATAPSMVATPAPQATVDAKTGVYVLPPGCEDAYQKYLDLAPTGPYANDVKAILAQSQTKVQKEVKNKK